MNPTLDESSLWGGGFDSDILEELSYCKEMLSLYEGAMTAPQSKEYSEKIYQCELKIKLALNDRKSDNGSTEANNH